MPVTWKPKQNRIQELIAKEEAKLDALQEKRKWQSETNLPPFPIVRTATLPEQTIEPSFIPSISPTQPREISYTPLSFPQDDPLTEEEKQIYGYEPPQLPNLGKNIPRTATLPQLPSSGAAPPAQQETPLWQKGLNAFTAPFNWVSENVTEPFGAVVTSPFTSPQGLTRGKDENWLDFEKRQYERLNPLLRFGIESVPWFLIPGAGQVGTATRAGTGIAGALGRAGTAGKVLGKAVELSPWGLAEKATGKVVGAVVGKGVQVVAKPVDPRVAEFTNLIKNIKPMSAETRALQHAALVAKAGKLKGIYKKGYPTEDVLKIAKGALKGELPKVPVSAFSSMAKKDINYLRNMIHTFEPWSKGKELNRIPTEDAFNKLFFWGEIPTRGETQLLETVFGQDMVKAILSKRSLGRKAFDTTMDAIGIPKALVSSFDISFPARQGILLVGDKSGAWWKSWKPMMKALFSDKNADVAIEKISNHPLYNWLQNDKLYQVPINKLSASLSQLEESFPSRFANYFPWVRASARAFGVSGNVMRADTYYYHVGNWLKEIPQGLTPKAAKLAEQAVRVKSAKLANYINKATGRGSLLGLERSGTFSEIMNAAFFSPKFVMSRIQTPFTIFEKDSQVRNIIARDLAIFLGSGMSALTLAKMGGAKVELDPRSTDFGKVRIGNTRIDFWGGYQPLARYTAQFVTGARKTASGGTMPVDRLDTAGRFVQSKLSPTAGLILDAFKGQNLIGEPLEFTSESMRKTAWEKLAPMFVQDLVDAAREEGLLGVGLAIPSAIGGGVTTYPVADVRDKMAQQTFGQDFENLSPAQKSDIMNMPEVRSKIRPTEQEQNAYKMYDQQIQDDQAFQSGELTNKQWRDRLSERQAVKAALRGQFEGTYPPPDTPEEQAQAGYYAIFDKLPENAMPSDIEKAMEEADAYMATLPQELAKYVNDNRWSNSTPLMKEFKKASLILRPYWEIEKRVIRLFGQTFAESSRGKSLIAKLKKRMRLSNREVAKAYNLFYKSD